MGGESIRTRRIRRLRTSSEGWCEEIPRHRRYLLIVLVLGIAFLMIVPSILSTDARAAETDKTIVGTVSDLNGDPVSGADVTVEIWGQNWPAKDYFRDSKSDVTDYWGYYEVTFDSNHWDPHNSIIVTVTNGVVQESHIVEADEDPQQMIDVTISPAVPEFGGPTGIVSTIVGLAMIFAIMRARRRK